jgi:hypothetical protein
VGRLSGSFTSTALSGSGSGGSTEDLKSRYSWTDASFDMIETLDRNA